MSGHLYYLMGASGSGKDALLQGCRQQLHRCHNLFIAHRYITRPAHAGGENHIHLSESEFELRRRHGMFSMDWASHGHFYGIGKEIEIGLAHGLDVIVNGSRAYLPQALEQFSSITPIMVTVDNAQLKERLIRRGRESAAEIELRLKRHQTLLKEHVTMGAVTINNNGSLDKSITALINILNNKRGQ